MQSCLSLDFLLNYSTYNPMKFSRKTLLTSAIAYHSTNSSVCQLPTVSFYFCFCATNIFEGMISVSIWPKIPEQTVCIFCLHSQCLQNYDMMTLYVT